MSDSRFKPQADKIVDDWIASRVPGQGLSPDQALTSRIARALRQAFVAGIQQQEPNQEENDKKPGADAQEKP